MDGKLQTSSPVELDKHLATHRALFALLANLALSAECRGMLWKVEILFFLMTGTIDRAYA